MSSIPVVATQPTIPWVTGILTSGSYIATKKSRKRVYSLRLNSRLKILVLINVIIIIIIIIVIVIIIREFSNDDGDGNGNVKKTIGLMSKTTTLHVHHAFLYIFLPLLHDCDVKMPIFTFYGGRKQAKTKFSLSF